MSNERNEIKSEIELIKEGGLLASYGKNYFFTINSALAIGKIKCSVVKIGTQGKDSFEIYLQNGEVKRFVDDILKGTAFKKIAEERSSYPSTYVFTKGVNGCNILNIGKSTSKGFVGVQAGLVHYDNKGNKGKTDFRITPVPENDLRDFAVRYYVCVCGLLPTATGFVSVPERSYYSEMNKAFWEGEANREKIHAKGNEAKGNEPKTGDPESEQKCEKNPNSQDNSKQQVKPSIRVRSTSTLNRNDDGSYRLQAVKESDGSIVNIRIPSDAVTALGEKKFNAFLERVNTCGSEFGFTGKKIKENGEEIYIFAEFIK